MEDFLSEMKFLGVKSSHHSKLSRNPDDVTVVECWLGHGIPVLGIRWGLREIVEDLMGSHDYLLNVVQF
jgi:hypothetical protein